MMANNNKKNYIFDSIHFLSQFENLVGFKGGEIASQDIVNFYKLFLDAVGLVAASGGNIQNLIIGDTKLIDRKRDIIGAYKGDDSKVDEKLCASLFQGWIRMSNSPCSISKDLRNLAPKDSKTCDFLLGNNGQSTLVECKRFHSTTESTSQPELVEKIVKKITDRIGEIVCQFESTELFLGIGQFDRHVVLDISSYGKDCERYFDDHIIVGLLGSEEISQVISQIEACSISGVDEITLCWSELFLFESKPRAYVFRTAPLKINESSQSIFRYSGWTIEFYPLGKKTNEFLELRVSSTARSQSWIKTSWLSSTDNLATYS